MRISDWRLSDWRLTDANLTRADLTDANLTDANLRYAIGNGRQIKTLQTEPWIIVYTDTMMAIGCQQHSIEDWFNFDNDTIDRMDSHALTWWKKWKPILATITEREL